MAAIFLQNTSDGMVNHAEGSKMLLEIPSSMNTVIKDQLVLNLFVFKTHYRYYINRCYALPKFGKLTTQNSEFVTTVNDCVGASKQIEDAQSRIMRPS